MEKAKMITVNIAGAENLTINQTSSFNKCESQQGNGGGIYAFIRDCGNRTIKSDTILGTQSSFTGCKSNGKNGSGIYAVVCNSSDFKQYETLITLCEVINGDSSIQSGFCLGIFLVVMNDYNVSNLGIDLSKAYFNCNEAVYGKNLYVFFRRFWTPSILLPITIPDGVIEGFNKLWYQNRDSQLQGRDIYGCGWCDDACRTFEIGLQEVSLGIGGNETALIENKTIMISDDTNGYDQIFRYSKVKLRHQKTTTNDGFMYKMIPYSTGPRGVVQIDLSVKDIQILNWQFENIIIDSPGGSALRIENFTDTPPIIPPLILQLPHPEPDTSINITIHSTSFKNIQSSGDIS
ncbi:MAG: hypothetical protein EZS28_003556, partial [Streblomastix strix]